MRGWIIALIITLAAASYQRMTGPTYPIRGKAVIGGTEIPFRLTRTHGGPGDQKIAIRVADASIAGELIWRRFPTSDPETMTPMRREDGSLVAELPHQPPAGKIEYRIRLSRDGETVQVPADRTVITRFKGHVPKGVLIPHVILMFCAMLYSNRAMIEVFQKRRNLPHYTWGTATMLFLGGLVLGPIVQKAAFGAWWTGIPFGYDLTDNKTLIAFVVWLIAIFLVKSARVGRAAVFAAAVVTLVIFAIPHSLRGSEYKYEEGRSLSEVVVPPGLRG